MVILIILALFCVAGIAAALWFLKNDSEPEETSALSRNPESASPSQDLPQEDPSPDAAEKPNTNASLLEKLTSMRKKTAKPANADTTAKPKPASSLFKSILEKLPLGKKSPKSDDVPETTPLPNLKERLETENPASPIDEPQTGTAKEDTLSEEEEKTIEKEIDLSGKLSELQKKYEKLDSLFSEKSAKFEKTKESLNNELGNRKEFNKVQDLLEKELKDSKDKARKIQVEFDDTKTEGENSKRRTLQLEGKVTRLEKELLEKKDSIDELVKRLQTFASPTTAATPPIVEKAKNEEGATTVPATSPPASLTDIHKALSNDKEEGAQEKSQEPKETETPEPEKDFLKLQPDILSKEPRAKDESSPQPQPPQTSPDNQEQNSQDNNDNTDKE